MVLIHLSLMLASCFLSPIKRLNVDDSSKAEEEEENCWKSVLRIAKRFSVKREEFASAKISTRFFSHAECGVYVFLFRKSTGSFIHV